MINSPGQINSQTERANILSKIIKENNPKFIVEIGTWNGLGSTKVIIDEINHDVEFYSLESNYDFYKIAKQNLNEVINKVKLLYGRIVEVSEINDFLIGIELSSEQKIWLEEDLNNFKKCNNIINELPPSIDFLLLDGGEFSTYSEWLKLKNFIKIVALDDINVLKCNKIYTELISNDNFELLHLSYEGNGFAVFKKK